MYELSIDGEGEKGKEYGGEEWRVGKGRGGGVEGEGKKGVGGGFPLARLSFVCSELTCLDK